MAKGKFEAFATMLAVFNSSTPASLLEFCTDSVYASGETCPGWAPSAGSGCCYDLAVVPNNCYTWDEFPNAPADLVGDLNYVYVPDELAGCQFYKTTDCTIGADDEWDDVGTGSYNLLCRYHLAGDIQSWSCDPSVSSKREE